MPRSNRRKLCRVAIIFHTTLVPIEGNPYIKTLLESRNFRQTVEYQFSVETGLPGANLDWSSVVLDSQVTDSTRLEKWEQLAGPTQPLFAIRKRLQPIDALPTTPVEVIEEVSTTSLQPVEGLSTTEPIPPDPSVPMTSNMSSSSEVAKEPTMAEMMAQITALTNLQRDHSLEIKGLTDKITSQDVRIAALRDTISAQNNQIDVLDMKLEDAAKTDRRLSSKIEELQKKIDTQGRSIKDMMPLTRDLVYRKAMEWYRNLLFDRVGRKDSKTGKFFTTKELIERVKESNPSEFDSYVVEGYPDYSKRIHKTLTKEQARLVLDEEGYCSDENIQKIFALMFSPKKNKRKQKKKRKGTRGGVALDVANH